MSAELPPEAQAVIDAALAWDSDEYMDRGSQLEANLEAAIANYRKATAPPEPFEVDMTIYADGSKRIPQGEQPQVRPQSVWRCTVTPIERVR